jgi:hypothetical protein
MAAGKSKPFCDLERGNLQKQKSLQRAVRGFSEDLGGLQVRMDGVDFLFPISTLHSRPYGLFFPFPQSLELKDKIVLKFSSSPIYRLACASPFDSPGRFS